MLRQIEGSRAIAETVANCRPGVICAYPISPQTHIVEALDEITREGEIPNAEFINVESEFSAMSVAIGSSAAGVRTYTATASQGLLFMVEPLYNASGLGLPIVMTVANRAIGAPINIWNDHSDSMSQRDSGWIQLYASDNQSAADMHVLAFRLAETLSLPVMVCMDGFILTHAMEQVDVPDRAEIQRFLPNFVPFQKLDVDDPTSIGAMVGPEAFTEVRFLAHKKQLEVFKELPAISDEFEKVFGRRANGAFDYKGLLTKYAVDDADTVIVALGSTLGTIQDVVDELRPQGHKVGVLGITSFRPFPFVALHKALANAKRVVVLERALAAGVGGIVEADVRTALAGLDIEQTTVIAGLGGRPITRNSIREVILRAERDELPPLTFLDLKEEVLPR